MKIAGIVCEYNPFHNGHAAHIARTRERLGGDAAILCVMSGSFVQRGEPAVFPKHARAAAAVAGGADLVLELPVPWACATAERFALGAVSLLAATGLADAISFGSECGDAARLDRAADALLAPETDALIRERLAEGVTYAAARQAAVRALIGREASLLSQPNDILAVEYLKALKTLPAVMEPVALRRETVPHDGAPEGGAASAMALRELMAAGEPWRGYVPAAAAAYFPETLRPVWPADLAPLILYRLRTMSDGDYLALPDCEADLARRMMRAGRTAAGLDGFYAAVKTKRYTLARIRRLALAALLQLDGTAYTSLPPYLRVLAFNGRGQDLLRRMKKTAALPVLTKPAAARALPPEARRVFETEARAADIYALATGGPGGGEWTRGPVNLAADT